MININKMRRDSVSQTAQHSMDWHQEKDTLNILSIYLIYDLGQGSFFTYMSILHLWS